MEFYATISVTAGNAGAAVGFESTYGGDSPITGLSYTGYLFDSSTVFTWCAGFSCKVKDFKVWYFYSSVAGDMYLDESPRMK